MKVLHILSSIKGGAAKAAIRLHYGLLDAGVESKILTLSNDRDGVKAHFVYDEQYIPFISKLKKKFQRIVNELGIKNTSNYSPKKIATKEIFSNPKTEFSIFEHPLVKDADVINMHWVASFLDYTFFVECKKPIVWTLHDMYPFTGGCHYSYDCERYLDKCDNCPQLLISKPFDSALRNLKYKMNTLNSTVNLTVVTPSEWLANLSKNSILFNTFTHKLIPYGIDNSVFKFRDKLLCRDLLGLSKRKKLILFVSDIISEKRKGFGFILELVKAVSSEEFEFIAIGSNNENATNINPLGFIRDELLMSFYYNAADAFVIPSLADNFPNTVLESLMCGTPVVGFRVGGVSEQLDPFGFGTELKDGAAGLLAKLLIVTSYDNTKREAIAAQAHLMYSSHIQAENYLRLYEEII